MSKAQDGEVFDVDAVLATGIADQPPPVATGRRPTWEIVAAYVEQFQRDEVHGALGIGEDVISFVLTDMRARDAVGRRRYGIPLTSGNGRDHLVDAYQEYLDASVYLAAELDEHGVGLTSALSAEEFPDWDERWHLRDVQQLCISQIRATIQLRSLIEERRYRRAELAVHPVRSEEAR